MKETIELSPSILDYLNQEPEERKYWRSGYVLTKGVHSDTIGVYDSEDAAWGYRAKLALKGRYYYCATDAPYQVTRQEVNEFARNNGLTTVIVLCESGQIVEEWKV